jgi:acetolactate synthase regulatory subunit
MSQNTITVLVVLRDTPHALGRLLARCHARGWTPVALRSVSDGTRCEVTMRLRVPPDRRGTEAQVHAQLERLVDAEHVAVDTAEGELPDDVAFGAVRRKAAWIAVASPA